MDEIKGLLERKGVLFKGKTCKCPYHNDKHASAGIYQTADNNWRFKCQSCEVNKSVWDLKEEFGENVKLDPSLETYTKAELQAFPNTTHAYTYTDKYGKPSVVVLRQQVGNGPKKFLQCRAHGQKFVLKGPHKKTLPYNLIPITGDTKRIIVVEGEKACEALDALDLPDLAITTSIGGSKNASKTDWSVLKGKEVAIWPDNDEAGTMYSLDVKREIWASCGRETKVELIDPKVFQMGEKQDAFDFIERWKEQAPKIIQKEISKYLPADSFEELTNEFDDIEKGVFRSLQTDFPLLQSGSKFTSGKQVIVLCGEPGSSKSFLVADLFKQFLYNNEKVAMLALEDDVKYHTRRVWALHRNEWGFCDMESIKNDTNYYRKEAIADRSFLKTVGENIYAPKGMTYKGAVAWIEAKAKASYDAIFVDPITMLSAGGMKVFEADQYFMSEMDRINTLYKSRIFIVTHPKTGNTKLFDLDSMAGGASINRFSQVVLWITSHDLKKNRIFGNGNADPYEQGESPFKQSNKTIWILKARNGKDKRPIELLFGLNGPCFEEVGIIDDQKESEQ